MKQPKTLAEFWVRYAQMMLPGDASPVEVGHARLMFYGGFVEAFRLTADDAQLRALNEEVDTFLLEVVHAGTKALGTLS